MTTSNDFGISADVLDATPSGSHAILGGCSSCVAVTVGASTGVCPSFVFVSACAGLALCCGCTLGLGLGLIYAAAESFNKIANVCANSIT